MLLGLWLFVALLAAVPELHHVFHAESDSPTHHCAVEQLSTGSVIHSSTVCGILDPVRESHSSLSPDVVVPSALDARLVCDRGPPCATVLSVVAG